jgi:hypothetical protein
LHRAPRVPRQWIAFDYGAIEDKDTTKRAGSFAINPVLLVALVRGILTGSIERSSVTTTAQGERRVHYEANVSRDKAERRRPEDERELIDKIFAANAIGGRVFPVHIWLDERGNLRTFEVRMRQRLSSVDRADLTVTLRIEPNAAVVAGSIARPDRRATARVSTLGQLVTAVSGA